MPVIPACYSYLEAEELSSMLAWARDTISKKNKQKSARCYEKSEMRKNLLVTLEWQASASPPLLPSFILLQPHLLNLSASSSWTPYKKKLPDWEAWPKWSARSALRNKHQCCNHVTMVTFSLLSQGRSQVCGLGAFQSRNLATQDMNWFEFFHFVNVIRWK